MFEKVNPEHPDKVADRIAGAIVDLAYEKQDNPKIAVEVLIGHGKCQIMCESSAKFTDKDIKGIMERVAQCKDGVCDFSLVPQDVHLANNQKANVRCGDNGIFKGMPITNEQRELTNLAKKIYSKYPYDGKYLKQNNDIIICQSNCSETDIPKNWTLNPLGYWTGGTDVDSGATNRKLGSDMGDAVTGGGLHGKDLSKADVSVNIMCHLLAQEYGFKVNSWCAIGDTNIKFLVGGNQLNYKYSEVVSKAKEYIHAVGGFEKFAEWGLIR